MACLLQDIYVALYTLSSIPWQQKRDLSCYASGG